MLDDLLAKVRSNEEPPTREYRWRLAVHEAGHAVAATLLGRMEVAGVSIGDRNGATEVIRVNGATDPAHCHELMIMLMVGRAAEELMLGSPSAGAGGRNGSDLALATGLAKDIELRFGFGELGPVFLADGHQDPLVTVPGLLASVSRRVDRAKADAVSLLDDNRTALGAVSEALNRSGYLSTAEVSRLVGAAKDTPRSRNPKHRASSDIMREHATIGPAGEDPADEGDAANPELEIGPDSVRQRITE